MGKVSAQRKLLDRTAIILKVVALMCLVSTLVCSDDSEVEIPEIISRRLSDDVVFFRSGHVKICNLYDNHTYMVDERRCVSNQELINGIFLHLIMN